jgi:hypothetical protein
MGPWGCRDAGVADATGKPDGRGPVVGVMRAAQRPRRSCGERGPGVRGSTPTGYDRPNTLSQEFRG